MVIERRFFKAAEVRVSASGGIAGYAAVFDQLSEDLGGFREKILPGAFSRCLGSDPDVRCLFNHNADIVLGRTKAGTLRLSEDRTGLYFDCDLPDTQAGRDVRASVKRGDITQCSFGFQTIGQNWKDNGTMRELTDVELFDVSPVTYPAYSQTSVSARQQQIMPSALLFPDGIPAEVRTRQSTARKGAAPAPAPALRVSISPATEKGPLAAALDGCTSDAQLLAVVNRKLNVSPQRRNKAMRYHASLTPAEDAELRLFARTGNFERRDLTSSTAGVFIPEAFNAMTWDAMRAYDAIFDDGFSTLVETDDGAAYDLFQIDDTETAASIVGEGTGSSEVDPTLFKVQLAQAPVWDSKVVAISYALLQDSAVDFPAMLAKALGLRLARGISPSLISTLLASADLGATANGDPNTSGATGANSIGYADLISLRTSVNPAYRASGKCGWLMNDDTLAALDSLTDKNGRPILPQTYVDGQRVIMSYPVGICPSLPDIGHDATPILFGALGYFAVRVVKDGGEKESGRLIRIKEAAGYPENLLVGFKSFLRCNGALLAAQSGSPLASDSPVKYLQNS
jgi:hypothetical protein